MLQIKIFLLMLSLNQEQQLNQQLLSVSLKNFWLKNMAVKKQINVSMQQQIKKKVPLKLMLMQTTGILLLFQTQLADVSQF